MRSITEPSACFGHVDQGVQRTAVYAAQRGVHEGVVARQAQLVK